MRTIQVWAFVGLVAALGLGLPGQGRAAAPLQTLNYQGRVTGAGGNLTPVADSSTNSVFFAIYTVPSGVNPDIWHETQTNVVTKNGFFNVILGSVSPVALPFDQQYYLGVNFNGDGEMFPRQALTMAPYAFNALSTQSLQLPYSAVTGVTSTVLSINNSSSGGVAVRGQSSGAYGIEGDNSGLSGAGVFGSTSGNGPGVSGNGVTGVAGTSTGAGGVGVLASAGSNGSAGLWVIGGANFQGPGNVSFTSGVDFSGATVTGLNPTVSAPLSLSSTGLVPTLSVTQGGIGAAIFGRSFGSFAAISGLASGLQGSGIYGEEQTGNGAGVVGRGIFAGVSGSAASPNGVGVQGIVNASNGTGVMGFAPSGVGVSGTGSTTGVLGNGLATASNGVVGQVFALNNTGNGVWAINGGLLNTGYALRATNSSVNGTAAYIENTGGLGGTALDVSGNARFEGGGHNATFYSYVSFAGGTNLTYPIPLTLTGASVWPGGVITATNTGNGFGIVGAATFPGTDNSGPPNLSTPVTAGLYGYTNSTDSAGVLGKGFAPASTAGVVGLGMTGIMGAGYGSNAVGGQFFADAFGNTAVSAQSQSGTAGSFQGPTGLYVSANGFNPTVGLTVQGNSPAKAMIVQGDVTFGNLGNTVTFTSNVVFMGSVTGVNNSVVAPLSLTSPSTTTALSAYNFFGGPAVLGQGGVSGSTGIYGKSTVAGAKAVVADGFDVGLSATSSTNGSSAIVANQYGGAGQGVSATGGNYGVLGYGGAAGISGNSPSGTGLQGSSTSGYGVSGNVPAGAVAAVFGTAGGGAYGVQGTGASGAGVFGSSGTNDGVFGSISNAALTVGAVHGTNFGSGYGLFGHSNFGTGVYGDNGGNSLGYGVEGYSNAATAGVYGNNQMATAPGGPGVQGLSLIGVGGSFNGVTGVVASGGSLGLAVSNGAVFNGPQNVTFNASVNFAGGVSGLNVSAPLSLTSTSGAAALSAYNTNTGPALFVKSTGYWGLSATTSSSPGTAIYGEGLVINSNGVKGFTSGANGYGIWGTTNNPSGTGVYAEQQGGSGNALLVSGNSTFNGDAVFNSGANSVTFNSAVFFSGPVAGLSGPLSLTSAAGPALYAFNSSGGTSVVVSGNASSTGVLVVKNGSSVTQSYGVQGIANGTGAVRVGVMGVSDPNFTNPSVPTGVYGYSLQNTGVEGFVSSGSNTGAGVRGDNNSGTGYGVLAVNNAASGAAVGLSATGLTGVYATSANGTAIVAQSGGGSGLQATNTSLSEAVKGFNNSDGSGVAGYNNGTLFYAPAVYGHSNLGYGGQFVGAIGMDSSGYMGGSFTGTSIGASIAGSVLGLSVTASGATGNALVAHANTNSYTLESLNDSSAATSMAIYGSATGGGTGVKGDVFGGTAGGTGVLGSVTANNTTGVAGIATTSTSFGVNAVNAGTISTGVVAGAALNVSGTIKVNMATLNDATAVSLGTWNVNNATAYSQGPYLVLRRATSAASSVTLITVPMTTVSTNSVVIVSWVGIAPPPAYSIQVLAGSFQISLPTATSFAIGNGFNALVINN